MTQIIRSKDKKRFVIYTRCSTDDQAQGDFTTLDAQAHHCKNMLDAFGYELADIGKNGIVNDDGYSGKDLNRPGIQTILSQVKKKSQVDEKRPFDGIIFFRLDRLTRNPRDLYSLIDTFRDSDIDFISVRENLDSSTAIGRVVIGILGLLSAFERELTGERVKASAIARTRQGMWVGGMLPYGYKLVKNGDPLPNGHQPKNIMFDERVAPYLKILWEMAADNKSLTRIGQELHRLGIKTPSGKDWRRQCLSRIIKNPFYKGYLRYSGELHKGNHPALIDETLWEKANRIVSARLPGHNFVQKARQYEYLLAGIIKCGECGSYMMCNFAGGRDKKRFFYYECNRSKQALGCSSSRISATVFDQAIIDYFKRASEDQEIIVKAIGDAILDSRVKLETIERFLKEKETKLNDIRSQADNLLGLAMKKSITQGTTYKAKMAELETLIAQLETEIDKLQAQKRVTNMNANAGEFLYSNIRFAMQHIGKVPPEVQKNLIQALIKEIIVYEDKIAINMYIEQPIEEALPGTIPALAPTKEKRPTKTCEALTDNSRVSTSCHDWLPELDSNQRPNGYELTRITARVGLYLYRTHRLLRPPRRAAFSRLLGVLAMTVRLGSECLVSAPAYAKASAGKPSTLVQDWLRIAPYFWRNTKFFLALRHKGGVSLNLLAFSTTVSHGSC